MSEPDVPVNVIAGVADGAVLAAERVSVAEGCACVSVRVDELAVTPVGRREIETEIEPVKELSDAAVTVMLLLEVPAMRDREPGDTAREKSGVGFGAELPPQVVSRERAVRATTSRSALAKERMSGVAQRD